MNKREILILHARFANIYLKDMRIKDIKYLWIGFIQVQNYLMN